MPFRAIDVSLSQQHGCFLCN